MIALKNSDMYSKGEVGTFPDGTRELLRTPIRYSSTVYDKFHLVVEGDMLDNIAYKYYSTQISDASKYWWIIADANNIENPLDLSDLVGTIILIPDFLRVQLLL